MNRLLILGSGTFALETLDIAELAGELDPAGFVNSLERPPRGAQHGGLPLYWADALPFGPGECLLVAGIVSPLRHAFVAQMEARGYRFVTVRHPAATISPRAVLAAGCVVNAGVVVSSFSVIGPHTILNRGCLIGHHNRIGACCTVGPGANLAGGVELGAGVFVGVGAVVSDHLCIGAGATVAAGAVVTKPVAAGSFVVGAPARALRSGALLEAQHDER